MKIIAESMQECGCAACPENARHAVACCRLTKLQGVQLRLFPVSSGVLRYGGINLFKHKWHLRWQRGRGQAREESLARLRP